MINAKTVSKRTRYKTAYHKINNDRALINAKAFYYILFYFFPKHVSFLATFLKVSSLLKMIMSDPLHLQTPRDVTDQTLLRWEYFCHRRDFPGTREENSKEIPKVFPVRKGQQ
jgi:hypothetical protein